MREVHLEIKVITGIRLETQEQDLVVEEDMAQGEDLPT